MSSANGISSSYNSNKLSFAEMMLNAYKNKRQIVPQEGPNSTPVARQLREALAGSNATAAAQTNNY